MKTSQFSFRMIRLTQKFVLGIVAMFAVWPAMAATYSHCVTTSQELQNLLTQAYDDGIYSGYDIEIFLAKGTYITGVTTGNGAFHYASMADTGSLSIHGGYGANCGAYDGDPSDANGVSIPIWKLRQENT
jgi:hypothetical protein